MVESKRNRTLRIAFWLFCLTMLSACVLSGTLAKNISSDYSTDEARVAVNGVVASVKGDLFGSSYKDPSSSLMKQTTWVNATQNYVSSESSSDDVVAPGTTGSQTIAIKGTPETSVRVHYDKAQNDSGKAYADSEIMLKAGTYGVMVADHTTVEGEAALNYYTYTSGTYTKCNTSTNKPAKGTTVYALEDTATVSADYYPVTWSLTKTDSSDPNFSTAATAASRLSTLNTQLSKLSESTLRHPNKAMDFSATLTWQWAYGTDTASDTILGYMLAAKKGITEQSFKDVVVMSSDSATGTAITYATEDAATGSANQVVNAKNGTTTVACLTEAFSQRVTVEQVNTLTYTLTGSTSGGTVLSSTDLLATESSAVSYSYNGNTVKAYNGYISKTSGATLNDANAFVAMLNGSNVVPEGGSSTGKWRLLDGAGVTQAATTGGEGPVWQTAAGASKWGNVEGSWSTGLGGTHGYFFWFCRDGGHWYTNPTTYSAADLGFVLIWDES